MNIIQQGPAPDATTTRRGVVSISAQTFAGVKTFQDGIASPEVTALQSSSHAALTLSSVGSSPNASGASLSGQVLTLQPASGTQPGVVTAGAQTLGGVKTFSNKIVVASQGGGGTPALEFSANLEYVKWPTAMGDCLIGGWNLGGEPVLYVPNGPIRTQSGTGFVMGGVNSSFTGSGLSASANSHLVDLIQGQATQKVTIGSSKGASSGVVVKVGSFDSSPHADSELLRVGYNLGNSSGSDGTAVAKFMGDNRVILGAKNTAPTDANLMNGSISFYLDESGNNLKVRVKYANGTLKTGTLAIS